MNIIDGKNFFGEVTKIILLCESSQLRNIVQSSINNSCCAGLL